MIVALLYGAGLRLQECGVRSPSIASEALGQIRLAASACLQCAPFAASHVRGRCCHIRANIRAHRDIQSEHDARRHADSRDVDESGLLQK